MKKILVVGLTDNLGGIESFFMTYYRRLSKKKFHFDFVTIFDSIAFQEELEKDGCRIYSLPNFKKHPYLYEKELRKIMKENSYDVVHVNMLSAANILPLKVASSLEVKKIIAHSHNSNIPKGIVRKVLHLKNQKKISKYANTLVACSKKAGNWLFGENANFTIIHNAVEIDKFKYNENYRKQIREKLNVKDSYLIGHIGRFCEQKNQEFIIKILKECSAENKNIKLVFIGDGKDKETIRQKVKSHHLEENVIFLENTLDVYQYYSAFDLFIMPSKFEGLVIVGVESQANGLPTLFSDTIAKEIKANDNVEFLSIQDTTIWKDRILSLAKKGVTSRHFDKEKFQSAGYDIDSQTKNLERIYEEG